MTIVIADNDGVHDHKRYRQFMEKYEPCKDCLGDGVVQILGRPVTPEGYACPTCRPSGKRCEACGNYTPEDWEPESWCERCI